MVPFNSSYLDVDHVGLDDVEAVGVDQVVDQMNSFLKIIFELEFRFYLLCIQILINPELLR
jgi:hypothetical protein